MNQQQQPSILTCQIIAGALIMGVVMFAGVTVAMHMSNPPPQPAVPPAQPAAGNDLSPMLMVAAFFTVSMLIARFIYLKVFDRNMAGKISDREAEDLVPEDVLGAYQTRLIVSLALLEGVAFYCLIAFMTEDRWEPFGIAMFLVLIMAISFPTENKFRNWVRKITGQSAYAGDE